MRSDRPHHQQPRGLLGAPTALGVLGEQGADVDRLDQDEVVEGRSVSDDDGHLDEASATAASFATSSAVWSRNTPCADRMPSIS